MNAGREAKQERILVIKLGALGDFIQALGPMKAIRDHHDARDPSGRAHVTLLTTPPFEALGRDIGLFDEIWTDGRARGFGPMLALIRRMSWARFTRVYDLQTSSRSSLLYHLLFPRTEWSGIARGCSHPDSNPERTRIHTVERQREQLRLADIPDVPLSDVSPLASDLNPATFLGTDRPYVLLVPGAAPHRPAKRWPADRYAALARLILEADLLPVVLGGPGEKALGAEIAAAAPGALDVSGQTSFGDIVRLAQSATAAVGNDTGPMHLIGFAGTPATVLFGADSDPARCAPRGPRVTVLSAPDISDHCVEDVAETLPIAGISTRKA